MKVQRLTNETMITLILIILFSCRIYYNPSSLFEKFEECNNRIRQKHELELVQHANTDKKILVYLVFLIYIHYLVNR